MPLKMRQLVILILGAFSLLLLARPGLAQEPDYDRINQIAEQLNCPTCAGLNLADCNTLTCEQWRDQINDLIEQGYKDQEVLDYFSARYGDQVLQEPPRQGFTLVLWVLPVIVLVAGGGWLIYAMRGWARRSPAILPAAPTTPPMETGKAPQSYLSQVEKDLGIGDER